MTCSLLYDIYVMFYLVDLFYLNGMSHIIDKNCWNYYSQRL